MAKMQGASDDLLNLWGATLISEVRYLLYDPPSLSKNPKRITWKRFKIASSKGTLFFGNHTKHTSRLVYNCSLINYTRISIFPIILTHEMAIKAASGHQSLSGGLLCSLGHNRRSRKKAWWGILAFTIGTVLRPRGLVSVRTCALLKSDRLHSLRVAFVTWVTLKKVW